MPRRQGAQLREKPIMVKCTADEYTDVEVVRIGRGLRSRAEVFRTMGLDQVRKEAQRIREGLAPKG